MTMKKEEQRSKRVTGRIRPSLCNKVEAYAKKQRWSVSAVIETALEDLVA
jgi:predicted HicB family RNase H-like nuclease